MASQTHTITLLSKNLCGQCIGVKALLKKAGIEFTERNMSLDESALELAISLGATAAPVTIVDYNGARRLIFGMQVDELTELVEEVRSASLVGA